MHLGHSESVVRGQPSLGFIFSYDLSSGLSDHLGVKEGFCLIWLNESKTVHAALAVAVRAFSTNLMALGITIRISSWIRA